MAHELKTMGVQTEHVSEILEDHFGEHGPFILIKKMKEHQFIEIDKLSPEQKKILLDDLIENVFSEFLSRGKLNLIESALKSAMGLMKQPF